MLMSEEANNLIQPTQILQGSYIPSRVSASDWLIRSSSIENDYIPIHGIPLADFKQQADYRFCIYNFPKPRLGSSNKLNHFRAFIATGGLSFGYNKGDYTYYTSKQNVFIYVSGQPLFLYTLCYKKSYLFGGNLRNGDLDPKGLVAIINRQLELPEHKTFYNILKKYVLNILWQQGVDTIITDNINQWCWNPIQLQNKFPTLAARREYLDGLTNDVINGIARELQ